MVRNIQKRISLRGVLAGIIFILFIFISLLSFIPHTKSSGEIEVIPKATNTQNLSPDIPQKIRISKIDVLANVEIVGLTETGAMDAPVGPKEVGWYKGGPVPGKVGNSVIDGHSGWKNGKAVFDDLHKLERGDEIQVVDKSGEIFTFVVRELKYYDKDANTNEVFENHDGKRHLNLITCTGAWNPKTQTSSERLVVFSDLLTEN